MLKISSEMRALVCLSLSLCSSIWLLLDACDNAQRICHTWKEIGSDVPWERNGKVEGPNRAAGSLLLSMWTPRSKERGDPGE